MNQERAVEQPTSEQPSVPLSLASESPASDTLAPEPALRREAIVNPAPPAEPHRTVVMFIAGMALLSLLIPVAIVWTQSKPAATVVTIETRTIPEETVVIVEREVVRTPALPSHQPVEQMLARDDAIGEIVAAGRDLAAERPWVGVAASPGPYAVAAVWSASELFVSRDDGRSFVQVLGGPGEIGGAAIDEVGNCYVVRDGQRLGVHTPEGQELWRALPFAGDTLSLVAADGWLAWLGLAHDSDTSSSVVLAVSADGGQTWRTQRVAEHADQALIALSDGEVFLLTLVEDSTGPTMKRLRGHVDGRAIVEMDWPTEYADAWGLGHGGWAYAIASECADADSAICAMGPDRGARLRPSGVATDWDLLMHSSGAATLAVSGERLLRANGGRLTVVGERIPAGISALAVDGIERALAVIGGHLVRWSPKHGWRVVHTASGQIIYSEG